jgi:DNA-3-methyladenine glycosylase
VRSRPGTDPRARRRRRPAPAAPPRDASRGFGRPLARAFYARGSVAVARGLLGRLLVCATAPGVTAGRIVEVEAYGGEDDPASHARPGPTPRNASMYGPPGHAYVYFTYGMHHCLNLVTGCEGRAAAVLIRALEPVAGLALMRARRGPVPDARLAGGPGCVAQALGLDRRHDGLDLAGPRLWVSDLAPVRAGLAIARGPRVGIRVGLDRAWRFWLEDHPCVSARARGKRRSAPASPTGGARATRSPASPRAWREGLPR